MRLKYKNKVSVHDQEIKLLIAREWANFDEAVYHEIGHLEEEYLKWRRRVWQPSIFIALAVLFLGIISVGDGEVTAALFGGIPVALYFILAISIGGSPFSIIFLIKWKKVNLEFNRRLNPLVFQKAFNILGFSAAHTTINDIDRSQLMDLLDHSELITENRNQVTSDDLVYSEYGGRNLFLAELDVKNVTGPGKHRKVKEIFHGMFISYDLPKSLEAKTFVSTEGDKKGFGNQNFWSRLFRKKDVAKETMLEWNEFEDKLHVATTDEIEARYILTTDLMQELYDWWKEQAGNIRISFISNRMYILFPDRKVKIGRSTASLKREHLEEYILTIARPMWHVARLLGDIDRRFKN